MRHLDCPTCTTLNGWHSFSRWGSERVAFAFAYKGGQYLSYDSLQPMPALITQDARPKIVDALLTLISRMGLGVFVYIYWSQRWPVHPKRTTTYHRWYFMINSRITECDHKLNNPEMQNRRLDPTGPAKPGETCRLTGKGPWKDRQEAGGRVFEWFWNRTELFVWFKPKPLVGYPDPLLTLVINPHRWSGSPATHCAMLCWSGKRTKVFIQKLPSQSWKRTDLIARTTSITILTVVRKHPAVLQRVAIW